MIRKALTYLTILAITALPVQLISASAESVSMQMTMSQLTVAKNECLHEMSTQAETAIENYCCDQQSNGCQGCNDIPQATSVIVSPSHIVVQTSLLKTPKISISHLLLDGAIQKNLLRPPRTLI